MAYGVMIRTTRGMSDLGDIRALREVWRSPLITTQSGSLSIPAGISTGAIVGIGVNDNREPPNVAVGTNSVTWTSGANTNIGEQPSVNFRISLYKVK